MARNASATRWRDLILFVAVALGLASCQGPTWRVGDDCGAQREALEEFTPLFGPTVGRDLVPVNDVGGYFRALRGRGDRRYLIKTVAMDLADENANIDGVTVAFRALRDCRIRLADRINSDLLTGEINQRVAKSNMEGLRATVRRDLALVNGLDAKIVDRGKVFRHAADKLAKIGPITAQPRIPVERSDLSADEDPRRSAKTISESAGRESENSTVAQLVALGEINHAKRELLVHEIAKANRGLLETGQP